MPYYTIKDKNTNEIRDVFLSIVEKEKLLRENSNLEQIFTKAPMVGDPVRLGVKRVDDNFRDILKNVKKEHVQSTVKV